MGSTTHDYCYIHTSVDINPSIQQPEYVVQQLESYLDP